MKRAKELVRDISVILHDTVEAAEGREDVLEKLVSDLEQLKYLMESMKSTVVDVVEENVEAVEVVDE